MAKKKISGGNNRFVSEIRTIGFMSTPKSGKTKHIKSLMERIGEELGLRGINFNNEEWKEKFSKGEKGVREAFNMGYLVPLIQAMGLKILDYKNFGMEKPDYIIPERNAYDFEAFTGALVNLNCVGEKELLKYIGTSDLFESMASKEQEKYDRLRFRGVIRDLQTIDDLVIYIKVPPTVAMEREEKTVDGPRWGNVMNIPFLTELNKRYDALVPFIQQKVPLLVIDGEAPFEKNRELIFKESYRLFVPPAYSNGNDGEGGPIISSGKAYAPVEA